MKRKTKTDTYKKYRLKQNISFAKYSMTLIVLALLVLWAPNQAAQFTGYLGAFILGSTKLKSILGL